MTHSKIFRLSFFWSDWFLRLRISLATNIPKMSNLSDVFLSSSRAILLGGSSASLFFISWSWDLSSIMIVGVCFGVDDEGWSWLTYWFNNCCWVISIASFCTKRRLRPFSTISGFIFGFGSSYSTETWNICWGWAPLPLVATMVVSLLLLLVFSDEFSFSSSYFS